MTFLINKYWGDDVTPCLFGHVFVHGKGRLILRLCGWWHIDELICILFDVWWSVGLDSRFQKENEKWDTEFMFQVKSYVFRAPSSQKCHLPIETPETWWFCVPSNEKRDFRHHFPDFSKTASKIGAPLPSPKLHPW